MELPENSKSEGWLLSLPTENAVLAKLPEPAAGLECFKKGGRTRAGGADDDETLTTSLDENGLIVATRLLAHQGVLLHQAGCPDVFKKATLLQFDYFTSIANGGEDVRTVLATKRYLCEGNRVQLSIAADVQLPASRSSTMRWSHPVCGIAQLTVQAGCICCTQVYMGTTHVAR